MQKWIPEQSLIAKECNSSNKIAIPITLYEKTSDLYSKINSIFSTAHSFPLACNINCDVTFNLYYPKCSAGRL